MKKDTLTVIAAIGVFVVVLFGAVAYRMAPRTPDTAQAGVPERSRENLVRLHSPTLGKPDAPVVIVEFFDPACGTCREFYPFVKQLMSANPDRIRLVLRYAPFHEGSDRVVAILEAARKQGKFWPALEALLAAQSQWVQNHRAREDLVWKSLEGLGLNLTQVRSDMTSPEIARVIKQDLDDVRVLEVTQTPEFFVNGRPMPSFGYDQLRTLVDEALASAAR